MPCSHLYAHHLSTVSAALATIRDIRTHTYLGTLAWCLKQSSDIAHVHADLIVNALRELDGITERASKRGHRLIAARFREATQALHTAALYNPHYQVWDGDRFAVCESHATRWVVCNGHGIYWIVVGEPDAYHVVSDSKRLDPGSEEASLAVYLVGQAKANRAELNGIV